MRRLDEEEGNEIPTNVLTPELRALIMAVGKLEHSATPLAGRSRLGRWIDRLGTTEFRRRIWHITPGLLPPLLWPIPHADPLSPTLQVLLFTLIGGIATAIFVCYRQIERSASSEKGRNCILGYAGTIIAAIALFPDALEIAMGISAILAFGDGSATVGGKIIGGAKLPWNREKTWAGFFAFLIVGVPMATLMYYCEAHNVEALGPPLGLFTAFACCGATVLAAAIAESIESPIDDNLRVGLTALVMLPIMHALLVGWH